MVAGTIIFGGVLNAQSGWINQLLRAIGIADPPRWFTDPVWAVPALNLLGIWAVGNAMLILLASLQGVPTELYEAATIDGAGWWQKFIRITIPMISPVIFYNVTLGVILAFQYFVPAMLIGGLNGDPQRSLLFFPLHFYRQAFVFSDMGYASVLALLLFADHFDRDRRPVLLCAAAGLLRRRPELNRGKERIIMTTLPETQESRPAAVPFLERGVVRHLTSSAGITLLGLVVMLLFLMPLGYMLATGFKQDSQLTSANAPVWPAKAATYNYEGEDYPLYNVPTDQGMKRLALVKPHRENSDMVDPANPAAGIFNVTGRWRTWEAQYSFSPTLENFHDRLAPGQFPAAISQYLRHRDPEHHRRRCFPASWWRTGSRGFGSPARTCSSSSCFRRSCCRRRPPSFRCTSSSPRLGGPAPGCR